MAYDKWWVSEVWGVWSHSQTVPHISRLKFPLSDFWCHLCADVKLLENQAFVEGVHEQVNGALLEYTLSTYPQFQEKFSQLMVRLPELRSLSTQAEDYLCYMHLSGEVPCNNLLIEMLHAKRACVWGTYAGCSSLICCLLRWDCVSLCVSECVCEGDMSEMKSSTEDTNGSYWVMYVRGENILLIWNYKAPSVLSCRITLMGPL